MSKNIKLNDTNYTGISTVQLPTTDGGTATFKDTDEITTPVGSINITENGTFDVANFAQAIVNVATSGETSGSGVTITPYEVTENADRSLWLNEKGIKLVKGVNLLVSSKTFYNAVNPTYVQGAVTLILFLWDGVAGSANAAANTQSNKSHIRGFHIPQSTANLYGTITAVNVGNTSAVAVAEDGLITCTTSSTGVTTGNYNNSFIEGGYTYYLLQAPSEEMC